MSAGMRGTACDYRKAGIDRPQHCQEVRCKLNDFHLPGLLAFRYRFAQSNSCQTIQVRIRYIR